ncbi:MAG: hypothetical protein IAE78_21620 [Myxococcus sp.]|nr:hypothetical protein [Myxococcus sp.]
MIALLALTLAAVPTPLSDALALAAPEGTRVEITAWSAPACQATHFEPQPIDGSGRVAVRASGRGCAVWGWATVRVFTTQAVATRDLEAGASLEGAVRLEEREWLRGAQAAPRLEGATASRRLRAGVVLRDTDLRFGPAPGTQVTVRLTVNAISIEQRGTIIACGQRVCASLSTGKRVAGVFRDGVLVTNLEGGT